MLKLTRKTGETVRVGEIVVKVEQLRGGYVSLSFDGPRTVEILRGELEKRKAA